jgi:hypothetical protein
MTQWCRCQQRPPLEGSDLCFICSERPDEPPQAILEEVEDDETTLDEEFGPPYSSANTAVWSVILSCLAFVLGIGIFVGWCIRGMWD